MDNLDFSNLESLTIVELQAIYSFSKSQNKVYQKQLKQYAAGTIEATSMNRIGNICSYYERLIEECQNIIDEKIVAIIGKPEF